MENSTVGTMPVGNDNFKKFDIPVKMGIIIALVRILIDTIQMQFTIGNMVSMGLMTVLSVVVTISLLAVTGVRQRKAKGGYITIKEAFQAIFVAILIFVAINGLYGFIYMEFIDPEVVDRIQESSMTFTEQMGGSQEQLDKMQEQFEKQKEGMIGQTLLGFLGQIVLYSIAGMICAAIIKKQRPHDFA